MHLDLAAPARTALSVRADTSDFAHAIRRACRRSRHACTPTPSPYAAYTLTDPDAIHLHLLARTMALLLDRRQTLALGRRRGHGYRRLRGNIPLAVDDHLRQLHRARLMRWVLIVEKGSFIGYRSW